MWMEFTWRVADGEYTLDSKLADIKVSGFDEFFGKNGWTVQDLFTAGNPILRGKGRVSDVAFGSLLHTVEDSFAQGHVEREKTSSGTCSFAPQFSAPPRIIEFHSYAHQDEKKHKDRDSRSAFEEALARPVNVTVVGKPLKDFYEHGASWETVKPYFECVFAVVDPNSKASAGIEFATR